MRQVRPETVTSPTAQLNDWSGADMTRNFVTECLDSKLIPLGSENSKEAHDCLLRLRLHFLIRILMGDAIVVPQGWALGRV